MSLVLERPLPAATRHEPVLVAGNLEAFVARHQDEVDAAQRLRWQVFQQEMGARLGDPAGLDRDRFDPFCDHVLVRERDTGRVVGTYRLLRPEQAALAGGRYIEQEFDITALRPLLARTVELGRSCVAPEWRGGTVIMLLWSAMGRFLDSRRDALLLGCVSVPMGDDGIQPAALWNRLAPDHLSEPALRVHPRAPLALRPDLHCEAITPPLVKGYLRAGARILGVPHVDRDFGCADFPMLVELEALNPRHARRFRAGA